MDGTGFTGYGSCWAGSRCVLFGSPEMVCGGGGGVEVVCVCVFWGGGGVVTALGGVREFVVQSVGGPAGLDGIGITGDGGCGQGGRCVWRQWSGEGLSWILPSRGCCGITCSLGSWCVCECLVCVGKRGAVR
jgi:hypothetical protein